MTRHRFPFVVALLTAATTIHADPTIEVSAGKHDRRQTPVAVALEKGGAADGDYLLMDGEKRIGRAVVQTIGGRATLFFLLDQKAGSTRRLRVAPDMTRAAARIAAIQCIKDDKNLTVKAGGKNILQYHHALVTPPDYTPRDKAELYTRSAFIHPVWTPGGTVITNAFPKKHLHHYGVWFPWRLTNYEGTQINFWEVGGGEGTIRCAGVEGHGSSDAVAWFRVKHEHVALKLKDSPRVLLNETWDVRVYPTDGHYLFDITSTHTCATDKPLTIEKMYYGGMGLRGADAWEDPNNVEFYTSDGKTRADGNFTAANWVEMHGQIDGKRVGVTVLSHPSNFRSPQKTRIHPKEPFLNFVPAQDEPFVIEPGKPYVSRYRYYVHDGELDVEACRRVWNDYAEPPVVKVVE